MLGKDVCLIYCALQFMEVVMKAVVSTKGRLTIPAEVRKKYNIKPGSRVEIEQVGNVIKVRPMSGTSK